MDKKMLSTVIKSYWWLPFALISIVSVFVSIFIDTEISTLSSLILLAFAVLGLVGWLTREKPEDKQRAALSNTDDTIDEDN